MSEDVLQLVKKTVEQDVLFVSFGQKRSAGNMVPAVSHHLKSSVSHAESEKRQFPTVEEHSRKRATRKMRVQMVHGFRSKKYPIRYNVTSTMWFCSRVGFTGFGSISTGIMYCKQYILTCG